MILPSQGQDQETRSQLSRSNSRRTLIAGTPATFRRVRDATEAEERRGVGSADGQLVETTEYI